MQQFTVEHTFTRDNVDQYAAVTGDDNSIHMDDVAAQALGFETAIVHGMFTLGWAIEQILERSPSSSTLREVTAKFTGPIPVGSTATLTCEEQDDARGRHITAQVAVKHDKPALIINMRFDEDVPEISVPEQTPETVHLLEVDRELATRFACALGNMTPSTVLTSPILAFALPPHGFLPRHPENEGMSPPDPVRDCKTWAQTTTPVVHGGQRFQYRRQLEPGEHVRATTWVTGRNTRTRADGSELTLTDVVTVFTSLTGDVILSSEMNLVVIHPLASETEGKDS